MNEKERERERKEKEGEEEKVFRLLFFFLQFLNSFVVLYMIYKTEKRKRSPPDIHYRK